MSTKVFNKKKMSISRKEGESAVSGEKREYNNYKI